MVIVIIGVWMVCWVVFQGGLRLGRIAGLGRRAGFYFLAGLGDIRWTRIWALFPVVCEAAVLDECLALGKHANVLTHFVFRGHDGLTLETEQVT